jgi:PAS domain S-box-containing protein
MKTLIKIFFIALAVANNFTALAYSFSADTSINKISSITIAAEPDYPPYSIIDNKGNATGFSIDLFLAAAKAVNINVEIHIGVWSQIKQDLAEGKIDALPLVGRTPEREELYDFTMPYLRLHGGIFVKKKNSKINQIDDLKRSTIAVMLGDNAEEFARRHSLSEKIITTYTFEDAFRLLNDGKVDAVIAQQVVGLKLIKKMGLRGIIPLDISLPSFRQDFFFAVKKGNAELLEKLNEGLSIVIANKTFNDIHLKWFGPTIKEKISTSDIIRIGINILIPLIIFSSLVLIVLLRRLVRDKTKGLRNEIEQHQKTLSELNRSQLLLEKMEKVSKIGGWDYDVKTQKILWTKGVYSIYGVSPQEFNPSDKEIDINFYHPDDKTVLDTAFQQIIETGKPYDLELRLIDAKGIQKWVWISGQAEYQNGIIVRVFGSIMDVTKTKYAEEKLKLAASDWQTTFDSSKDAIWIMDKDNLILRANKTSESLFNANKNELIGRFCWEVVHDTCEPLKNCPVANIKQSLSRETGEFKIGSRLFEIILDPIIDQNGEYNGAVHSIYDITETRKAEESLREQEEIFRHFMEHSPIYVFFKDKNIRSVKLSKNYEQLLNKPLNELLGKSMDDLFPSDLAKAMIADDQRILAEGKTITVDEEFNGRYYTTIKFPIIIDGKPSYLAGYTIDVTENKKAENELLELKNKLEIKVDVRTRELEVQLQKLDISQKAMLYMVEDLNNLTEDLKSERQRLEISNKELEAFSYSVSHDLRAPLRAVDGFSRLIIEDYSNIIDSEGLRLLGIVRENVQKMDKLITDLLSLSRVSRTEMSLSKIDMAGMAKSMFHEVIGNENAEKVIITIGPLPEIYADTTLMRQVWYNLIGNALKYSKPKEKQIVEIYGKTDNEMNVYTIKDNGVGFNPGYKLKIFDTFQRLHKSTDFEGTGIGLSIVQRIITRHGGRIWADSVEGEGATFCFSLPVREDK